MINETGSWQGEIWNRRKNGEVYPEWLAINSVKDKHNKIANYIGIFSDITERKRFVEHLKYLAHYDVLTGLPNRTFFHERLNQAILEAQRQNEIVALMFIDLDQFKMINDTLGHAVGDLLLQNVAKRLSSCVEENDSVSRLNGDEFTVILPSIRKTEDALQVLKYIFKQLSNPFMIKDQELFITVSIGMSLYPSDGTDTETLVKNADTAMYYAKEQSNNYELYIPDMNKMYLRRMQLANGLKKALEKEELTIVYQPQMDLRTEQVIGMEALLRWEHSKLGMISPNEFIPIAEENGLIVDIGEWVLRSVCQKNKKWQSEGYLPMKMAVNLSTRQLRQKDIVESVESILIETGLDPSYLCLEITEGVSIDQIDSIISVLHKFKLLGVEVAIDDFGMGYSSLSYLKKYPIHFLKIDKCFAQDIDIDPANRAIAKAIIDLAHDLNLQVIAEGVETVGQLTLLRELHCDYIQGYWLIRPLPPEEIELVFMVKVNNDEI
jgi:diguanylate cyclase (GGDEF)-like protein